MYPSKFENNKLNKYIKTLNDYMKNMYQLLMMVLFIIISFGINLLASL